MKAYNNIRLTEDPDICDIRSEGRRSAIGRLRRGEKSFRFKNNIIRHADGTPGRDLGRICHNDRGYCKSVSKAAVRRYLKRINRALDLKFEQEAN